ncbi:lysylphosphatidylglycerol synthase transmembrane domain-containing protein [Aquabacterium sp.]|uniref:lysylphosphatidylglycerol synthase transmembrane domain-containing protein n=1 Tax=Aquabacterium sp. TaxID=1872578 RepID=UPI0035B455BC
MKRASRLIKQTIGWALGLGLLGWLLHKLPLAALPETLTRIDPMVWAQTLAGLLLSYALRASRMQVVMAPAPRRLIAGKGVWRVMLMYNAALNLLPFRGGELSFPWFAARELGLTTAHSVAAWLWMRIQDVAVLALLGVLAWPGFTLTHRLGLVALWLAGALLMRPVAHWIFGRLLPARAEDDPRRWVQFAARLRLALEDPTHHHPLSWVYTLGNWLVKLAAGAVLISAACGSSFAVAWAGALGGELVVILPVQGPAGFGTYEAGVAAGMAWLGGSHAVAPQAAALAALCWHVTMLAVSTLSGMAAGLRPGQLNLAPPPDEASR